MATFQGTIKIDEQGNYKIVELLYFQDFCQKHKEQKCELIVKPISKKSDPLRNYYWGVIIAMIRQTLRHYGHQLTKEETHDMVKQFCPSMIEEICLPTGELVRRSKSIASKSFTNTDFLTYIEELKQWAAENLDVTIPDPQ